MTTETAPIPEVRNARFALGSEVPHDWHGGRTAVSIFFDNLSIFFPPGERFFIASVKAHKHQVHDEELLKQVRAFCGQEGMHTREHIRYNQMLRDRGYPVDDMEKRVENLLRMVSRRSPTRRQLAVTCALEHFTALMADALLKDPRVLEDADPRMASLWKWHAAEENEHKSVAYDVYRAAGGNYPERAAVMIGTTVVFWKKVLEHQIRMMRARGVHRSPRAWASALWFLFGDPGGLRKVFRPYFHYFRPGFHPWDIDNRDLLEQWKQELETSDVYREALHPTRAA